MSDDPLIDYMIMEAVAVKVARQDTDAAKDQERKQWKQHKSPALDAMR